MTSSDRSLLGLALQKDAATLNSTDASFKYFLFSQGAGGPQNNTVPLDTEIGGGALLRDVMKAGVSVAGGFEFIPRPQTLGLLLYGALGKYTDAPEAQAPYTHRFGLNSADQFDAPYFTVREAPGGMWGEQYQTCRINALSLEFRAANFLRGAFGLTGITPSKVATTTWAAESKVDRTPPFSTVAASVSLGGSPVKVLNGSFTAGISIPQDDQWVVGSNFLDAVDVTQRAYAIALTLKIADGDLYTKMAYDPANGTSWVAQALRDGSIQLEFKSEKEITPGNPYQLTIEANGETDADANVVWSCTPVALRSGRQVIVQATGVFLADPRVANDPIQVTLINDVDSSAYTKPA